MGRHSKINTLPLMARLRRLAAQGNSARAISGILAAEGTRISFGTIARFLRESRSHPGGREAEVCSRAAVGTMRGFASAALEDARIALDAKDDVGSAWYAAAAAAATRAALRLRRRTAARLPGHSR